MLWLYFNEEEHEFYPNDNQDNVGTTEINTKKQELLSLEIKGLVNFAYGKYSAIKTKM